MDTISLPDIKKQIALLQIAERYFDSVVLFALFETGVFKILSTGPKTFAEIRSHVRGDEETLRAALDASVALGVLSLHEERFAASEAVLDCLGREQSPAYLGEWVAFLHALATPLLQLGKVIQTGNAPGTFFEEMEGDNSPAKRMTAAMDAYARTRGIEILDHVDFSQTRRLLDVGCGPGTYSMAAVERYPHIRATLLDLPGPIAEARHLAANRGVTDRLDFVDVDARGMRRINRLIRCSCPTSCT